MKMSIFEENGIRKTRIRVPVINAYPLYLPQIHAYIALYGGREEKRSSRYFYYIIDKDLLNGRK